MPHPLDPTHKPLSRRALLQRTLAALAAAQAGTLARAAGADRAATLGKAHFGKAHTGEDLVSLVNTMQGTDSNWGFSRGNTLPLAAYPFGMTHWSPQNSVPDGWFFDPNQHKIQGVRATHQPSPWMGDYGHFTVMAQAVDAALAPAARASAYRPEDFLTGPDYFSVVCARDGVRLEMAPTERCAIFRFTFPAGGGGRVLLDAQTRVEIDAAGRAITAVSRMGYASSDLAACYAYAEFDTPFQDASPYQHGQPMAGQTVGEGDGIGAVVGFGPATTVVLRLGTSFISAEQARKNVQRELGEQHFEAVRAAARRTWNETLGVARVRGGTDVQRRTFYSCLYRAHLFPRLFHEYDDAGQPIHYSPFNGQLTQGVLYTDTGLWDGYHALYPLLSLLQPARLGEIVQGFVNAYQEGGWLPQWPHPGYHGTMGGTHSDVVLTEAILKDIPGFDRQAAFAAMWKDATVPPVHTSEGRGGLADYLRLGYLPVGSAGAVVSNTLDYAYDDACIGMAAARLGDAGKQQEMEKRARNYALLYDPSVGFMRPKNADGTWKPGFDEFAWGDAYTEGGPWQWSLSVPHDPAGLMALLGGPAALTQKLDRLMWQPPTFHVGGYGHEIHEMAEMAAVRFGQYDQGNQPAHQILAHYVAAGCPARMHFWFRRVLNILYTPDSFPGDEDNGEMASWYLLGALGLFPHCPGRPSYVFASPLFPEVVLSPPGGHPLTISAPATSDTAVYVRQVTFNGQSQERLWIDHQTLARGGKLEFNMADRPPAKRLAPGDLPPSLSAYQGVAHTTEAVPLEIAINCGGDYVGPFVGDCFVDGGAVAALETSPAGAVPTDLPADVLQTERQGTFAYRIPLPMPPGDGAYTVRLIFRPGGAARALSVRLNGKEALSNFNPAVSGGGVAVHDLPRVLPGPDGELVAEFAPAPGSPPSACGLSGIQIFSSNLSPERA